jgi:hypothetical protein
LRCPILLGLSSSLAYELAWVTDKSCNAFLERFVPPHSFRESIPTHINTRMHNTNHNKPTNQPHTMTREQRKEKLTTYLKYKSIGFKDRLHILYFEQKTFVYTNEVLKHHQLALKKARQAFREFRTKVNELDDARRTDPSCAEFTEKEKDSFHDTLLSVYQAEAFNDVKDCPKPLMDLIGDEKKRFKKGKLPEIKRNEEIIAKQQEYIDRLSSMRDDVQRFLDEWVDEYVDNHKDIRAYDFTDAVYIEDLSVASICRPIAAFITLRKLKSP